MAKTPLPTLHRADERVRIAQLMIDLVKLMHHIRLGKSKRARIAGEVETLLISGVVLIGHVKGTPRTASFISRDLGIPRATVQRKLAILEALNLVSSQDGKYSFVPEDGNYDFSYIDKALALIAKAAREQV